MRTRTRNLRSIATALTILGLFVLPVQSPQPDLQQTDYASLLDVLMNAPAWCHFLDGDKDNDILAGCVAAYQPAMTDVEVGSAPESPRQVRHPWEMASDVEGTRAKHVEISSHVKPRSPGL